MIERDIYVLLYIVPDIKDRAHTEYCIVPGSKVRLRRSRTRPYVLRIRCLVTVTIENLHGKQQWVKHVHGLVREVHE